MELSSPRIKTYIILSSISPQKFSFKKILIFFPKKSTLKNFLYFFKKKCFLYFGKRNFLISWKTKFSSPKNNKFQELTFRTRKTFGKWNFLAPSLKNSYVPGGNLWNLKIKKQLYFSKKVLSTFLYDCWSSRKIKKLLIIRDDCSPCLLQELFKPKPEINNFFKKRFFLCYPNTRKITHACLKITKSSKTNVKKQRISKSSCKSIFAGIFF